MGRALTPPPLKKTLYNAFIFLVWEIILPLFCSQILLFDLSWPKQAQVQLRPVYAAALSVLLSWGLCDCTDKQSRNFTDRVKTAFSPHHELNKTVSPPSVTVACSILCSRCSIDSCQHITLHDRISKKSHAYKSMAANVYSPPRGQNEQVSSHANAQLMHPVGRERKPLKSHSPLAIDRRREMKKDKVSLTIHES